MGLWDVAVCHYTLFNFGASIGGCSMPSHDHLTSKKKHGTLCFGRSMCLCAEASYLYSFFNFGARIVGVQCHALADLSTRKRTATHCIGS